MGFPGERKGRNTNGRGREEGPCCRAPHGGHQLCTRLQAPRDRPERSSPRLLPAGSGLRRNPPLRLQRHVRKRSDGSPQAWHTTVLMQLTSRLPSTTVGALDLHPAPLGTAAVGRGMLDGFGWHRGRSGSAGGVRRATLCSSTRTSRATLRWRTLACASRVGHAGGLQAHLA